MCECAAQQASNKIIEKQWPALRARAEKIALKGGEYDDCLTALDIDRLVGPVISGALSAMDLYRVRVGDASAEELRSDIEARLQNIRRVIAPLHVRHHWTTAVFQRAESETVVRVIDSAPSPGTARDITRLLTSMGIGQRHISITCPGRQPSGSNECGVHAIVNAWRAFFGFDDVITPDQLSLGHLRGPFSRLAQVPETAVLVARTIAADPSRGAKAYAAPTIKEAKVRAALVELGLSDPAASTTTSTLRPDAPPFVPRVAPPRAAPAGVFSTELAHQAHEIVGGAPARPPQTGIVATAENTAARNLCYMHAVLRAVDALTTTRTVPRKLHDVWDLAVRKLRFRDGEQMDVNETFHKLAEKFASFRAPHVVTMECNEHPMGVPKGPFIALDQEAKFFRRPASHEVVGVILYTGRTQRTNAGTHSHGGHYQFVAGDAAQRGGHKCAYVLRPTPVAQPAPSVASHVAPTAAQAATARATGQSVEQVRHIQDKATAIQQQRIARRSQVQAAPEPEALAERLLQELTTKPAPLGHSGVKRRVARLTEGESVFVHWSRSDDEGAQYAQAGRWFGIIKQRGPRAAIEFTHALCEQCGAPRAMEPFLTDVPVKGVMYMAFEARALPLTRACECVHVDPDDERTLPTSHPIAARDLLSVPDGRLLTQTVRADAPTSSNLDGSAGRLWYIYAGRPHSVHELVWRQLAASTRATHARWLHCIRGMPTDLRRVPFGRAITELVLRMGTARKWCWSTVASALSACASALASLPIYTTETKPIDIKKDSYFTQALQRAQHLARTNTGSSSLSIGMTRGQFQQLTGSSGLKAPSVRMLLMLCWHFAARVGDMRQVRPCDVSIKATEAREDQAVPTVITFRFGKGAAWWGPYSIHAILPKRAACDLSAFMQRCPTEQPMFSLGDQAALSAAVGEVRGRLSTGEEGRLNLRSVRRGALQSAAADGTPDDELQLLSGHKRRDTLLRYLGWGVESADMRNAAEARYARTIPAGAGHAIPPCVQPPRMGCFSGFTGRKGRRVPAQPRFFPLKAPSAEECGVAPQGCNLSEYKLHIKETSRICWRATQRLAAATPLRDMVRDAEVWCTSAQWYGPAVTQAKVPVAAFTADQVRQLLEADKVRPHVGPILGYVKAFTVAQHAKKRLRIIAEPYLNQTFNRERLYEVHYPSRYERRARARNVKFSAELDFAAFYDQFELSEAVMPYFVMQTKEEVNGHRLFALTRLPMGASFAPSVAQAVTSALVAPLLQMPDVLVDTMIDNVRVMAHAPEAFVGAMRLLLSRIKAAKLTLNDADCWETDTSEWVRRCAVTSAPRVFLGEKYVANTIANTDINVEKLRSAAAAYVEAHQGARPEYTKRNFASLVGLMLFMAHTVNVPLTRMHTMLRAYGSIISDAAGWDVPFQVLSQEVHDQIVHLGEHLTRNTAVELPTLLRPDTDLAAYDAAIEVDASLTAWGARVILLKTGETFILQQRWSSPVSHSAHAEPRAARLAMQWVRSQEGYQKARIALVTDHIAIATGQRRWYSNFGGFSTSYHLNACFDELYEHGGGEVFHVDGARNEADQLSRDPSASWRLTVRRASTTFRDLRSVVHPHGEIPRRTFQV